MGLSITIRAESPSLTALLVLWCTSCSGKRQSRAETSAPPKEGVSKLSYSKKITKP